LFLDKYILTQNNLPNNPFFFSFYLIGGKSCLSSGAGTGVGTIFTSSYFGPDLFEAALFLRSDYIFGESYLFFYL
tara:strand:- start:1341 stop:1565 length:225 start_codon:yes stop_codon:yes gene_type:complete